MGLLYVETKKGNSIAIIIIARAGGVVYTNFRGDMIEKTSEKIKPDAHKRQVLWGGGGAFIWSEIMEYHASDRAQMQRARPHFRACRPEYGCKSKKSLQRYCVPGLC